MKRFFRKLGRGFKTLGRKALWLVKRPEFRLASRFIPVPYITQAVDIVQIVEKPGKSGTQKFEDAFNILAPILREKKEGIKDSQIKWIIETALQIAEGGIAME